MKAIITLLIIFLFGSCVNGKENKYTGSTPADAVIRSFLGIPLSDSIDFIRWNVSLDDNRYQIQCNYGIGKPNTNGFINGGTQIKLSGEYRKEKNLFSFQNGTKALHLIELNEDLLHLLNSDNTLLVGNGGWSYTLNNIAPTGSGSISITASRTLLKDSMTFQGRTPCKIPGIVAPGSTCYKLKWKVVLYANAKENEPGNYKILGTPGSGNNGRTGNWIITIKKDKTFYQLNDEKGNAVLYLVKLDENILMFTDAEGKLLVGDEDFSYALNRL